MPVFEALLRRGGCGSHKPSCEARLTKQSFADKGVTKLELRHEGGPDELLEQFRRDVAGTVDDADDEDAVFFRAVEDQVVADRKRAETAEKMIDRTSQVRLPDKLRDDGAEAVDEAIRRGGIVPREAPARLSRCGLPANS